MYFHFMEAKIREQLVPSRSRIYSQIFNVTSRQTRSDPRELLAGSYCPSRSIWAVFDHGSTGRVLYFPTLPSCPGNFLTGRTTACRSEDRSCRFAIIIAGSVPQAVKDRTSTPDKNKPDNLFTLVFIYTLPFLKISKISNTIDSDPKMC